MSRSVRDNPINFPYSPKADFTLAEAEQRIAMCQAAIGIDSQKTSAGNCIGADGATPSAVGLIDIAKLATLAPAA